MISTCILREFRPTLPLISRILDFLIVYRRKHANGMMAEAMGILMFTFAEHKAK
jgi:hypothetical protein